MALSAGTRLGPYEVIAPLGAGGMGEVYRARDPRLGREVAVKLLPAEVAGDAERRARFEEEARAASALSHPNIVVIHDVGSAEGGLYIAMELVEGRSLRELLGAGLLPMRRLLEVAVQVAEGLAKAHAAGIVHRDLKPENLMLSPDGVVKILDFGLAKLSAAPAARDTGGGVAPTRTQLTQPGTVMGTVGYMSPEQAAGAPLDYRSDQFALGSILYEMATGQPSFRKDTAVETLAAILREEPAPILHLNPQVPAPLRWIVERCLAKDPEERYASTRDLARELRNLRDRLSEASFTSAPRPSRGRRRALWAAIAVAALGSAAAAGALLHQSHGGGQAPRYRQVTFKRGRVNTARFAADGRALVYSGAWEGTPLQLYLKQAEAPDPMTLALPGADLLAVSPAGEVALALGCARGTPGWCAGTLALAPLAGGVPREVARQVSAADWTRDGSGMLMVRAGGRGARLEFPAGRTLVESTGGIRYPRFSPGGEAIAYLEHAGPFEERGVVALVDREGHQRTLSTGWSSLDGLAWAPAGREVWFTGARRGGPHALYGVDLKGRERMIVSIPGALRLHDVSPGGQVLLARESVYHEMVGLAPGESRERNLSWLSLSIAADLSEDGRTLLFNEGSDQREEAAAIGLRGTDGAPVVRLGYGVCQALSPDRQWVIVNDAEGQGVLLMPTGPGESRPLALPAGMRVIAAEWFPDQRRILLTALREGRSAQLHVVDVAGGPPRPVPHEGYEPVRGSRTISPDGGRVVVRGTEGQLWLLPLDDGSATMVKGAEPGEVPVRFGPEGESLYVRQGMRQLPSRVFRIDLASGQRTLWKELSPADPAGVRQIFALMMTADGSAYVYTFGRILSELHTVEGLR